MAPFLAPLPPSSTAPTTAPPAAAPPTMAASFFQDRPFGSSGRSTSLREIWLLPFTLFALWKAARRWRDVDLIHINDVTILWVGVLAKRLLRRPLVVHARSVQLPSRLPSLARADAVVAIDETVRASLPASVAVHVIHNGFTPAPSAPRMTRLHAGSLRIGMVGTLLALKGVFEFLEAARLVLAQGANADFILVGSNTRKLGGMKARVLQSLGFARDMESGVERFIAEHNLG